MSELEVRVADMAWWREVSVRLADLLVVLDDEDLSDKARQKLTLVQQAILAVERG